MSGASSRHRTYDKKRYLLKAPIPICRCAMQGTRQSTLAREIGLGAPKNRQMRSPVLSYSPWESRRMCFHHGFRHAPCGAHTVYSTSMPQRVTNSIGSLRTGLSKECYETTCRRCEGCTDSRSVKWTALLQILLRRAKLWICPAHKLLPHSASK